MFVNILMKRTNKNRIIDAGQSNLVLSVICTKYVDKLIFYICHSY